MRSRVRSQLRARPDRSGVRQFFFRNSALMKPRTIVLRSSETDASIMAAWRKDWIRPSADRIAIVEDPAEHNVSNPDSEAGHGQTVSVEDPHRQPHAASRNAHAELR